MSWAVFNSVSKLREQTVEESFEKKHFVATSWEMTRTHESKNSFFKEAETMFH